MRKTNKAQRDLESFSARGSNCPICGRVFRSDDCPHTVSDAKNYLLAKVVQSYIKPKRESR